MAMNDIFEENPAHQYRCMEEKRSEWQSPQRPSLALRKALRPAPKFKLKLSLYGLHFTPKRKHCAIVFKHVGTGKTDHFTSYGF